MPPRVRQGLESSVASPLRPDFVKSAISVGCPLGNLSQVGWNRAQKLKKKANCEFCRRFSLLSPFLSFCGLFGVLTRAEIGDRTVLRVLITAGAAVHI